MSRKLDIFSDGACSGNPGLASVGVVIQENGKTIKTIGESIGEATNNIAEYKALVYALNEALNLKADQVVVHTDSELLFNQLRGTFKVKNENLKNLLDELHRLCKIFKRVEVKQIPREQNQEADRLAKQALKQKASQDGCPDAFVVGEESPSSKG